MVVAAALKGDIRESLNKFKTVFAPRDAIGAAGDFGVVRCGERYETRRNHGELGCTHGRRKVHLRH